MSDNDDLSMGTPHEPTEDCPYCPGSLMPIEKAGHEQVYQCDGSDCPATFVAVIET